MSQEVPRTHPLRIVSTTHAPVNTPVGFFHGCMVALVRMRGKECGADALELLDKAQFTRGALVVVELGVAVARLSDDREFGAEPQQGERPVVGGKPVGPRAILARAAVGDEGEPAPLVVRPAHLRAAADREAQGKGHADSRAEPAAAVALAPELRPLLRVAGGDIGPHRRRDHPRAAQGRIPDRAIQVGLGAVTTVVP